MVLTSCLHNAYKPVTLLKFNNICNCPLFALIMEMCLWAFLLTAWFKRWFNSFFCTANTKLQYGLKHHTTTWQVGGILHTMQWEINKAWNPKINVWQLFPSSSSSGLLYCSGMPLGSTSVNHTLVSEKHFHWGKWGRILLFFLSPSPSPSVALSGSLEKCWFP